jgi:hypothetical protein
MAVQSKVAPTNNLDNFGGTSAAQGANPKTKDGSIAP